jgi:hypothetical protein
MLPSVYVGEDKITIHEFTIILSKHVAREAAGLKASLKRLLI